MGKRTKEVQAVNATTVADKEVNEAAAIVAREPTGQTSIISVIREAILKKADVEVMRELLAVRREERADQAREAFANALVQFRRLVKPIIMTGHRDDSKTKKADGSVGTVKYSYAELTTTIEQIQPALDQCQLTPTWQAVKNDRDWIEIDCVLTHGLGHKERSLPVGSIIPPTGNRGQTPLQVRQGAITTLKRITLFMVLGLTTKEDDDHLKRQEEGNADGKPKSEELMNPDPDERMAREAFRAVVLKKTGEKELPNRILHSLLAQAQTACGSDDVSTCTEYIGSDDVIIGKDGTLGIVTHSEPEPDPLDTMPISQHKETLY